MITVLLAVYCLVVPVTLAAESKYTVRASFYADKFVGRPMAGGGKFSQDRFIAASLQFPLGSVVTVTSIKTGKSIQVTITDRGPWGTRFGLDMSKAAFQALGLDLKAGWGWVTVEKRDDTEQNNDR